MITKAVAIIEEDQAPVTLLSADGTVQVDVTVFGWEGPTGYDALNFSDENNSMYIPVIF